jgi:hypothetical protein
MSLIPQHSEGNVNRNRGLMMQGGRSCIQLWYYGTASRCKNSLLKACGSSSTSRLRKCRPLCPCSKVIIPTQMPVVLSVRKSFWSMIALKWEMWEHLALWHIPYLWGMISGSQWRNNHLNENLQQWTKELTRVRSKWIFSIFLLDCSAQNHLNILSIWWREDIQRKLDWCASNPHYCHDGPYCIS